MLFADAGMLAVPVNQVRSLNEEKYLKVTSPAGEMLRSLGVVGAGGAGFPTYVKAQSRAEFLLANGAECEPLLHKDFELMKRYPAEIVSGMRAMMESTHAEQGRFGIKEKNKGAVAAIEPHATAAGIGMTLLGDFYPSGDEYEIVYAATGRLIPAAGIPLQVGCVVNNVETLYNVDQAADGQPVTRKFVTVSGAVKQPARSGPPSARPSANSSRTPAARLSPRSASSSAA